MHYSHLEWTDVFSMVGKENGIVKEKPSKQKTQSTRHNITLQSPTLSPSSEKNRKRTLKKTVTNLVLFVVYSLIENILK